MWVLTFRGYPGLEGRSIWLRPGAEYTVGRSRGCSFCVDRRFVSSTHLVFKVGRAHDLTKSDATPLEVVLESKSSTYIDGTRYRYDEKTDNVRPRTFTIGEQATTIVCKKGTDAITISLEWRPFTVSYTSNVEGAVAAGSNEHIEELIFETAAKLDLRVSNGVRSTTDCYIDSAPRSIANLAYCLLRLIPVVDEKFLAKLSEAVERVAEDFDNFPKCTDSAPGLDLAQNEQRKTLFSGITFVTSDARSGTYYRPIIEAGDGQLQVLQGNDVDAWVKFLEGVPRLVVIQFLGLEKMASLNGATAELKLHMLDALCDKTDHKLCRGDDFLQAVLKTDVDVLFGPYAKRKAEAISGRSKRRKRLAGTQTRLDPLSLFVQTLDPKEASVVADPVSADPVSPQKDVDVVMDSEPDEPVLTSQVVPDEDPKSPPFRNREPKSYKLDVEQLKNDLDREVSQEIETADLRRQGNRFIDAIKQIKIEKKLVERASQTFGSPDDINIQDLIIIDTIDVISPKTGGSRAKGSSNAPLSSAWDAKWNGRKNFKNFVKVEAKSRGPARPMLSTTINYLPLQEYDPDAEVDEDEQYFEKSRRKDDDAYRRIVDPEASQRQEVDQFFGDKAKQKKPVNRLFVAEDEDEEGDDAMSFQNFRSQRNDAGRARRAAAMNTVADRDADAPLSRDSNDDEDDDDNDDDDDSRGLRFKFTRR